MIVVLWYPVVEVYTIVNNFQRRYYILVITRDKLSINNKNNNNEF